ncbi:MAG: hypothetical protein L6R48_22445 [Planctomycetes bacterium]|nr:hypothetical protein [Planctomycetota bacterium]
MAPIIRVVFYLLTLANLALYGRARLGRVRGEGWGAGWANLAEMAAACLVSLLLLIVLGLLVGFGRSERTGLEQPHTSLLASLLALPWVLTAATIIWVKMFGGRGLG